MSVDESQGREMGEVGTPSRVGVVGAGITGLALTHYLREQGVDVVTFEAASEPGGVIRSREVDGYVLEEGPHRVRLSGPLAELVSELGLDDAVVEANPDAPLYVYANGKLRRVPLTISQFLKTDLLSWRGKLRLLGEPLTKPARTEEMAAEMFRRKFGSEAYENVIAPLFGGIYGSDPAEMPVAHSLSGLVRLEQNAGSLLKPALKRIRSEESAPAVAFAGGNRRLPEALADEHADVLRLETPVERIRDTDDGFELVAGDSSTVVDEVVVTVAAPAAADLLAEVSENAELFRELTYNPMAMVYLDADHDRAGLGYQVRHSEPLHTLGVSWVGPAFDRDGVHTVFLGGMTDPDVLDRSDDELAEIARSEFEEVMGVDADVIDVARPAGFPAYDHTWSVIEEIDIPHGMHFATNYTARMGVPSRVRQAKRLAGQLSEK